MRLKVIYQVVFHSLVLMSLGSRKVAQDFDRISWRDLTKAYIENLGRLFVNEPDLDFAPPRPLLAAFGLSRAGLTDTDGPGAVSIAAAEAAARREDVKVEAL
jgi:hypothetical protein